MTLLHLSRNYVVEVPTDHVREFCHDKHGVGFFLLKSQIFLDRYEARLEPMLQTQNWFEREIALQCRRLAFRLGLYPVPQPMPASLARRPRIATRQGAAPMQNQSMALYRRV